MKIYEYSQAKLLPLYETDLAPDICGPVTHETAGEQVGETLMLFTSHYVWPTETKPLQRKPAVSHDRIKERAMRNQRFCSAVSADAQGLR